MYLFANFDNEELNFLQNVDSDDFDWTLHSVCHLLIDRLLRYMVIYILLFVVMCFKDDVYSE